MWRVACNDAKDANFQAIDGERHRVAHVGERRAVDARVGAQPDELRLGDARRQVALGEIKLVVANRRTIGAHRVENFDDVRTFRRFTHCRSAKHITTQQKQAASRRLVAHLLDHVSHVDVRRFTVNVSYNNKTNIRHV